MSRNRGETKIEEDSKGVRFEQKARATLSRDSPRGDGNRLFSDAVRLVTKHLKHQNVPFKTKRAVWTNLSRNRPSRVCVGYGRPKDVSNECRRSRFCATMLWNAVNYRETYVMKRGRWQSAVGSGRRGGSRRNGENNGVKRVGRETFGFPITFTYVVVACLETADPARTGTDTGAAGNCAVCCWQTKKIGRMYASRRPTV